MALERRIVADNSLLESDDSDGLSDPEPRIMNPRIRSGPGIIPLLETISAIGDLCDESDDSCDAVATSPKNHSEPTEYVGSDSIDSGYKSGCPTPDPDPSKSITQLNSLRQSLIHAIHKYENDTRPSCHRSRQGHLQGQVQGRRPRSLSANPRICALATQPGSIGKQSIDILEQEIDSLLHGRLQKQLEKIDPARVKDNSSTRQNGDNASKAGCTLASPAAEAAPSTRFSRVARCMLEIIEDLQRKYDQPPTTVPQEPPCLVPRARHSLPNNPRPKVATYTPDYHVYEEIIYDLTGSSVTTPKKTQPPPLPARPLPESRSSSSCASKPWFSALVPTKKDKGQTAKWFSGFGTKCGPGTSMDRPRVKANEYTFSSRPPHPLPRTKDQGSSALKMADKHADEEYGFKVKS